LTHLIEHSRLEFGERPAPSGFPWGKSRLAFLTGDDVFEKFLFGGPFPNCLDIDIHEADRFEQGSKDALHWKHHIVEFRIPDDVMNHTLRSNYLEQLPCMANHVAEIFLNVG